MSICKFYLFQMLCVMNIFFPQVIEQENGYDSKADIWSIGITVRYPCPFFVCPIVKKCLQAIELAKGRTPFEGQKPLKVLKSILRCDPPQLTGDFRSGFKVRPNLNQVLRCFLD